MIPAIIAAVSLGPLRLIHGPAAAGRVRALGVRPELTNLLPAGGVYSFTVISSVLQLTQEEIEKKIKIKISAEGARNPQPNNTETETT